MSWSIQLGKALSRPAYVFLATVIGWLVFTLAVWLPNVRLIYVVLSSNTSVIIEKIGFLFSLYGSIGTNFTSISALYTIVIAVLFGINISLLTYYIRNVRGGVREIKSTSAVGISGLVSGMFGIGCAACGTFILTSVLALFGVTGMLAYLPFGGEEFGFLGVGLLVYSIHKVKKKINSPLMCETT